MLPSYPLFNSSFVFFIRPLCLYSSSILYIHCIIYQWYPLYSLSNVSFASIVSFVFFKSFQWYPLHSLSKVSFAYIVSFISFKSVINGSLCTPYSKYPLHILYPLYPFYQLLMVFYVPLILSTFYPIILFML